MKSPWGDRPTKEWVPMTDPRTSSLKKELYELVKQDERIFDFIQSAALDGLWYWDLENPDEEWMNPRFWTVMGDTIDVESTLGEGSTFCFTVYLDGIAPAGGSKCEQTSGADDSPAGTRTESKEPGIAARILLVEDNRINRMVVRRPLARLGLQVDVAENGEEALQACDKRSYDLILMDLHMPVMDGYEATQKIRQKERQSGRKSAICTPIIALTADAQPSDREACLKAGMSDYLAKPVNLKELVATIRNWLPDTSTQSDPASPSNNTAL